MRCRSAHRDDARRLHVPMLAVIAWRFLEVRMLSGTPLPDAAVAVAKGAPCRIPGTFKRIGVRVNRTG